MEHLTIDNIPKDLGTLCSKNLRDGESVILLPYNSRVSYHITGSIVQDYKDQFCPITFDIAEIPRQGAICFTYRIHTVRKEGEYVEISIILNYIDDKLKLTYSTSNNSSKLFKFVTRNYVYWPNLVNRKRNQLKVEYSLKHHNFSCEFNGVRVIEKPVINKEYISEIKNIDLWRSDITIKAYQITKTTTIKVSMNNSKVVKRYDFLFTRQNTYLYSFILLVCLILINWLYM